MKHIAKRLLEAASKLEAISLLEAAEALLGLHQQVNNYSPLLASLLKLCEASIPEASREHVSVLLDQMVEKHTPSPQALEDAIKADWLAKVTVAISHYLIYSERHISNAGVPRSWFDAAQTLVNASSVPNKKVFDDLCEGFGDFIRWSGNNTRDFDHLRNAIAFMRSWITAPSILNSTRSYQFACRSTNTPLETAIVQMLEKIIK